MNGVQVKGRSVVVNKALNPEEKAQFEREKGVQPRERDEAPRRPHNSERPHFDRPPGPKVKGYRVTVYGLPETYTWRYALTECSENSLRKRCTGLHVPRLGYLMLCGACHAAHELTWGWRLTQPPVCVSRLAGS